MSRVRYIFNNFIQVILLTMALTSCMNAANKVTVAPKKEFKLTESLLYETNIWDIDKQHGGDGVFTIVKELKTRALTEDAKSMKRLFDILLASDGYIGEGVQETVCSIYEENPAFVLKNVQSYTQNKQDEIYKNIIYGTYYGLIFSKEYPPNIKELKKLGVSSKRILQMYEYYLKNPKDIENWAIDPPY
jgi:hypothetical protein